MFYEISKRILDIVVSIIALILFSPVIIIFAILIKLESPDGPIFNDINDRVGKDKKIFKMYKFRSMIMRAHDWEYQLKLHPDWKPFYDEWKEIGKLPAERDPRMLKIGPFIRKSDLDEALEFINVLIGNMSVVGPRAPYEKELQGYIEKYPEIKKYVDDVYSVKPGITGVWQVGGRNSVPIPERFKMDAQYARERNILTDIVVIIKTPIVMITRKGAM